MRFIENLINNGNMFHREDKSFRIQIMEINTSFTLDLVVDVGAENLF